MPRPFVRQHIDRLEYQTLKDEKTLPSIYDVARYKNTLRSLQTSEGIDRIRSADQNAVEIVPVMLKRGST